MGKAVGLWSSRTINISIYGEGVERITCHTSSLSKLRGLEIAGARCPLRSIAALPKHFGGGSTTKTCSEARMMPQISNRYFCQMDCSRSMSESCSCTLQMKTGVSSYTWPGCSSVFGGPSLFLVFVHKDSLWRRVLNSWFQIQDPSHL